MNSLAYQPEYFTSQVIQRRLLPDARRHCLLGSFHSLTFANNNCKEIQIKTKRKKRLSTDLFYVFPMNLLAHQPEYFIFKWASGACSRMHVAIVRWDSLPWLLTIVKNSKKKQKEKALNWPILCLSHEFTRTPARLLHFKCASFECFRRGCARSSPLSREHPFF